MSPGAIGIERAITAVVGRFGEPAREAVGTAGGSLLHFDVVPVAGDRFGFTPATTAAREAMASDPRIGSMLGVVGNSARAVLGGPSTTAGSGLRHVTLARTRAEGATGLLVSRTLDLDGQVRADVEARHGAALVAYANRYALAPGSFHASTGTLQFGPKGLRLLDAFADPAQAREATHLLRHELAHVEQAAGQIGPGSTVMAHPHAEPAAELIARSTRERVRLLRANGVTPPPGAAAYDGVAAYDARTEGLARRMLALGVDPASRAGVTLLRRPPADLELELRRRG